MEVGLAETKMRDQSMICAAEFPVANRREYQSLGRSNQIRIPAGKECVMGLSPFGIMKLSFSSASVLPTTFASSALSIKPNPCHSPFSPRTPVNQEARTPPPLARKLVTACFSRSDSAIEEGNNKIPGCAFSSLSTDATT